MYLNWVSWLPAFDPAFWEVEVGRSLWIQGQPGLDSDTLSQGGKGSHAYHMYFYVADPPSILNLLMNAVPPWVWGKVYGMDGANDPKLWTTELLLSKGNVN